ncbi:MAG: glucokinase [Alphaproteobacteria bacterium]|nr:glucokinase [Alphaproteobacteria bacterium]
MTLGLLADIGATNCRFALADESGISDETNLLCADYKSLEEAMRAYLQDKKPVLAVFDIAAPVTGDKVVMTNHPWEFSIESIKQQFSLKIFEVMNDFKAVALAIPPMAEKYKMKIGSNGTPVKNAPIGILGPGTGLGVASLVSVDGHYHAVPGEGGHVTVPVKTQREFDMVQALHSKYRHVSAERVCSGKGLVNIYNALRVLDMRADLPNLSAEEISTKAMEKSCGLCDESLTMMLGFLGTVAGNLAVTLGAFGGIYIAGGIPMKLGEYFFNSSFRKDFETKGRYEEYLRDIPTYLVTHPNIAFEGLYAEYQRLLTTA